MSTVVMELEQEVAEICGHEETCCHELKRTIFHATHRQIQQLEINSHAGVIVVRGICGSYYCKQLATTALLKAVPRSTVRNEICVISEAC